jgi:hypothetical protein
MFGKDDVNMRIVGEWVWFPSRKKIATREGCRVNGRGDDNGTMRECPTRQGPSPPSKPYISNVEREDLETIPTGHELPPQEGYLPVTYCQEVGWF